MSNYIYAGISLNSDFDDVVKGLIRQEALSIEPTAATIQAIADKLLENKDFVDKLVMKAVLTFRDQ